MHDMRTIRQALGLSQVQLAVKLGLHQSTISRFESGDLVADKRTVLAAQALLAIRSQGPSAGLICNTCERLASDPATRGCTTVGCGLHQQEAA